MSGRFCAIGRFFEPRIATRSHLFRRTQLFDHVIASVLTLVVLDLRITSFALVGTTNSRGRQDQRFDFH